MNGPTKSRIDDWLDDDLDPPNAARPSAKMTQASSTSSVDEDQRVAETIVVHGLLCEAALCTEERVAVLMKTVMVGLEEVACAPVTNPVFRFMSRRIAWSAMAAAIACLFLGSVLFWNGPRTASASTILEKMIRTTLQPNDRTYRIRVVDDFDPKQLPLDLRDLPIEVSNKQLEGAILHVRGANMFVLFQNLNDGESAVCGCDGSQSWAFKESGAVHVSDDLQRFRHRVPGSRQNLVFVSIQSSLKLLQSGYEIKLGDRSETEFGEGKIRLLSGRRTSKEVQGPKKIDIWFDDETGLIRRMFLDGLPLRGGGPRSVLIELISQRDLGDGFFMHQSHHGLDRKIRHGEQP